MRSVRKSAAVLPQANQPRAGSARSARRALGAKLGGWM